VLGGAGLSGLDQIIYQGLQSLRTPWADHLMLHFSRLADMPVIIPLMLGVTLFLGSQRHWRSASYCLAAIGFALLAPLLLKYGLRIPRPETGISGLGPFSFPSGHTLRATALFGFLSVMIARALPPPRRWLPYMLAGLLVMLVALARLYLGTHWLSDVVGAITLGLAWVALLGIAYHHHTVIEAHWRSLSLGILLLLTSAMGLQTWLSHESDLIRYTPIRKETAMDTRLWWDRGWRELPQTREDLRGHHAHPLQLQYGGELEELKRHLIAQGWQQAQLLDWDNALKLLSPSLPLEALPILPQVHEGRHETLILTRPRSDGSRLVLRLWATSWILTPEGTRLWLGSVSAQKQAVMLNLLTFPETQNKFQIPLAILRQAIDPFPHRTTTKTGTLLLLQGSTPLNSASLYKHIDN
jgi:undecaprenyl-diphosphatase